MSKLKQLYLSLVESGDIFDVFPDATGEWNDDKKEFTKIQSEMDDIIKQKTIDLDEEE